MGQTVRKHDDRIRGSIGATLCVIVGLILLFSEAMEPLSYDLPFQLGLRSFSRTPAHLEDVVVVKIDDQSYQYLSQTYQANHRAWDRGLYVQLLTKLNAEGAKLVVFDVFFEEVGGDPVTNLLFAQTIRNSSNVVLCASRDEQQARGGSKRGPISPNSNFVAAAAGWGVGVVDRERRLVRRLSGGLPMIPSLAWEAARLFGAQLPEERDEKVRWLNYYGPIEIFHTLSFYDALVAKQPLFKDKVVFIGGYPETKALDEAADAFPTPYGPFPGVALHVTAFLNLVDGDWLERVGAGIQLLIVMLCGGALGYGLCSLSPIGATLTSLVVFALLLAIDVLLIQRQHLWFDWMTVAGGQLPCALFWTVLAQTRRLQAENKELHSAVDSAVAVSPSPAPAPGPALAASSGDAPTQPIATAPPPLVPEYDLLRCIGEGAYGEVWLARTVVGLYVAVKIVRRHRFAGDGPFEREFKGVTKFMPLSRSHPGLVHLLHVGRNQAADYFYYVMEAADDETTGQRIHPDTYQARVLGRDLQQRGRLSIVECLRLSTALADALAFLHQHELIHRDIKPNNVIFVKGQPKFADVGLVTDVQREGHEVSFLGTEGYIAPEGPGAKVSDIYSLGRLIYMAAMGRDQRQFPDLPTALVQGADPAPVMRLNKIILTACAVNPSARYQSAEALRDALAELLRHLEGEARR